MNLSPFGSKDNHTKLSFLLAVLLMIVLALVGLDSFKSDQTVMGMLGFSSLALVVPALLVQLVFRLKFRKIIDFRINNLFFLFLVVTVPIVVSLSLLGAGREANFVFSLTRLNLPQLMAAAWFVGISFFINQTDQWWQKNGNKILFFLPLTLFVALLMVELWPYEPLKELVKEDNLIENGQFLILFVGGLFNLVSSWKLFRKKLFWQSGFFLLAGVGFIFIAGDEIAWGQRLFGFEVSESIKEVNRQDELTVHNLQTFEWLVIYGYIALSAFGVFSKQLAEVFILLANSPKKLIKYISLFPEELLFFYYLLPLILFVEQQRMMWGIWHAWSEIAELYLYAGVVLWTAQLSFHEIFNKK